MVGLVAGPGQLERPQLDHPVGVHRPVRVAAELGDGQGSDGRQALRGVVDPAEVDGLAEVHGVEREQHADRLLDRLPYVVG